MCLNTRDLTITRIGMYVGASLDRFVRGHGRRRRTDAYIRSVYDAPNYKEESDFPEEYENLTGAEYREKLMESRRDED